jgi:hypothetical protein
MTSSRQASLPVPSLASKWSIHHSLAKDQPLTARPFRESDEMCVRKELATRSSQGFAPFVGKRELALFWIDLVQLDRDRSYAVMKERTAD